MLLVQVVGEGCASNDAYRNHLGTTTLLIHTFPSKLVAPLGPRSDDALPRRTARRTGRWTAQVPPPPLRSESTSLPKLRSLTTINTSRTRRRPERAGTGASVFDDGWQLWVVFRNVFGVDRKVWSFERKWQKGEMMGAGC